MILDTLAHSARYAHLHPLFPRAFAYLESFSPETADGRHDLDGDRLFALVQTVTTAPAAEKRFEAHRRYIDIQCVVSGREVMEYSPIDDLRPVDEFDAKRDCGLFHEPDAATPLLVHAGSFTIFFPQDAHKPCCAAGAPGVVRKVVMKVEV